MKDPVNLIIAASCLLAGVVCTIVGVALTLLALQGFLD